MSHKAALVILDGFGVNLKTPTENAIAAAILDGTAPTFARLFQEKYANIDASGRAVGLPDGQIGNSEVGHMTLGLGRVIRQSMVRIDDAFDSGEYVKNPVFTQMMEHVRTNNSRLHVFTIFGTGGVHGHQNHLEKLLPLTKDIPVSLHLFGDGRDVDPKSFLEYWNNFSPILAQFPGTSVASIAGRYHAMDRDKNWERILKAYTAIVAPVHKFSGTVEEFVASEYSAGRTDEFFEPTALSGGASVQEGDAVLFLNYRSDRAKQIAAAFVAPETIPAPHNAQLVSFKNLLFVATTKYSKDLSCPVLFPDEPLSGTFGEAVAQAGLKQMRLAETEKYAHVTKFFNAGRELPFEGERDVLVPSHKVATFDLDPEMSAEEIYEQFSKNIGEVDAIVCNYANGDMVGHTGIFSAVLTTIRKLDSIVARTIDLCAQHGFDLILTADHGNCEEMGTAENPKTNHTLNPVPLWHIRDGKVLPIAEAGGLCDISPTLLTLLNVPLPSEMTGKSLLRS